MRPRASDGDLPPESDRHSPLTDWVRFGLTPALPLVDALSKSQRRPPALAFFVASACFVT